MQTPQLMLFCLHSWYSFAPVITTQYPVLKARAKSYPGE